MQNPFTTTFSKVPNYTYIPTEQEMEIIDNFRYDNPSESVYKITGVRGSGKTVLLAKIEEELSSDDWRKEGWIVCRLTPARDMLKQLASFMYKEKIIKDKPKSVSMNVSGSVLGAGGSIGVTKEKNSEFFDIGVELDDMLAKLTSQGKKILIGIDEVSKTPDMIVFASEYGKWLRAGYSIYLVCTGLYENIEQLSNVKNLTFFRRATTIKTAPLNNIKMSEMYKDKLNVDLSKAKELAAITKGYPYAFQELGVLYFRNGDKEEFEDIVGQLKSELYAYAYEKIWEEMSEGDRELAILIRNKSEYKRDEVMKMMEKVGNYSVYRDRLIKRGIVNTRHSYIGLALPYFGEYIKEYCI